MATSSNANVWEAALTALTDDERQRLDIVGTPDPSVLHDILTIAITKQSECSKRRLKFSWKGKPIILRDVFTKLALWLQRFIEVGDVAVQYDPVHAALPWAAVRFIISASIADIELYGILMQGTETVANTLTRCAIQETLYSTVAPSTLQEEFYKALKATYVSILKYLCHVLKILNDGTVIRIMKATFDAKRKLEELMLDVGKARDETDRVAQTLEGSKSQALADLVAKVQDDAAATAVEAAERDQRLLLALNGLRDPIIRIDSTLDALGDTLERQQRANILQAISAAPYPRHHKIAAKDRMADSGQWLLDKHAYREWRASSANSMLWLHGIPGSGKTKLSSLVVDRLANEEHIAYFYCARNSAEAFRARAEDILASIVRQLACTKREGQLFEPVLRRYEDALDGLAQFGDLVWTTDECLEVLLALVPFYPSVTIVLDALDEVTPDDRHVLIDVLHSLLRDSDTLVKVFVSSRENYDIVSRLGDALDVRIYMDENASDIRAFIKDRLAKNSRLQSKIDRPLEVEITAALENRAQGMFRLVDLQIQTLSALKTSRDIEARLHDLPATLAESYEEVYEGIKKSGEHAFALAIATFQWLLQTSESNIAIQNFARLTAYWPSLDGHLFTAEEVQDVCSVFVSVDESQFRFSHLTVREYLESRAGSGDEAYDDIHAHGAIASACLAVSLEIAPVVTRSTDEMLATGTDVEDSVSMLPTVPAPLEKYVTAHWAGHVGKCRGLTREPWLDRQLRAFMLGGMPAETPYERRTEPNPKEMGSKRTMPRNQLFFLSDIDRQDLLQELLQAKPACAREFRMDDSEIWNKPVATSPIWHVMEAKRVDHLRCILRCKPVGLVDTLCPTVFAVLEDTLRHSDVGDPHKDYVTNAEGDNDRHLIAERRAQQIVNHDAKGLAALIDALSQDTDLAHAIQAGRVQTAVYLVRRGIGTKYLSAALGVACSYNYTSLSKVLQEHGAMKEKPAVARALRRQLFQTATNLIAAGYEVNGRFFEQRRTALHYAVQHDRPDIVRLLLQHGARVQVYDGDGLQPHHLAAKLGRWECFTVLEGYGADVKLPDLSGRTVDLKAIAGQARADAYPDDATTDTATPDVTVLDAAATDVASPDIAASNIAAPDTTAPDNGVPVLVVTEPN